jgi:hypothetical protein
MEIAEIYEFPEFRGFTRDKLPRIIGYTILSGVNSSFRIVNGLHTATDEYKPAKVFITASLNVFMMTPSLDNLSFFEIVELKNGEPKSFKFNEMAFIKFVKKDNKMAQISQAMYKKLNIVTDYCDNCLFNLNHSDDAAFKPCTMIPCCKFQVIDENNNYDCGVPQLCKLTQKSREEMIRIIYFSENRDMCDDQSIVSVVLKDGKIKPARGFMLLPNSSEELFSSSFMKAKNYIRDILTTYVVNLSAAVYFAQDEDARGDAQDDTMSISTNMTIATSATSAQRRAMSSLSLGQNNSAKEIDKKLELLKREQEKLVRQNKIIKEREKKLALTAAKYEPIENIIGIIVDLRAIVDELGLESSDSDFMNRMAEIECRISNTEKIAKAHPVG